MTRRRSTVVALTAALLAQTTEGAAPLAQHLTVLVEPGSDAVITLRGYDTDGDALTAKVASLPATGTLSQLSKVFSTHSYDPKKGSAFGATGGRVTGSRNRVYYARPQYDGELSSGKWGKFFYTMGDGATTSKEATCTLVGPSGRLVASTFDVSNEGWSVVRNGFTTRPATFDASSFGAGLNRFVVATDEVVAKNAVGIEANSSRFAFAAPPVYHGNQNAAYDGVFKFTLGALAGDVASAAANRNYNLVEIECATCDVNRGTTLAFPLWATPGFSESGASTTSFRIVLNETAGWLKDPENALLAWTPPTKCEMVEVLSAISSIRILGDVTDWYESIALDDVALLVPADYTSHVPICAQLVPDASSCSCGA